MQMKAMETHKGFLVGVVPIYSVCFVFFYLNIILKIVEETLKQEIIKQYLTNYKITNKVTNYKVIYLLV